MKESIRQKQIIRVSERDQTLLASSPTHGWFTGKLIKCCSSLSEVHDSSSSSMDKLLLKPMITFLHLATQHNRMWLLALRAGTIQKETRELIVQEGNILKRGRKPMLNADTNTQAFYRWERGELHPAFLPVTANAGCYRNGSVCSIGIFKWPISGLSSLNLLDVLVCLFAYLMHIQAENEQKCVCKRFMQILLPELP